jgi:N-methylhydantoinase A
MFTLDIGRDYLRSYIRNLNEAKPEEINTLFNEMIQEALPELKVFKVSTDEVIINKSADLRYKGQYHEVEVELPLNDISGKELENLAERFQKKHEELYTFTLSWVPIEIRNLRLIAKIKGHKLELIRIPEGDKDASPAFKRTRKCLFNGNYTDTPVYDSDKLRAGNIIEGPAIIEVPTTTAVIPPDYGCQVDNYNNYIITRRF